MDISVQLEIFCGVIYGTSEQHIYVFSVFFSRVQKDHADVANLLDYFSSPFSNGQVVVSISAGVTGDEKIDCHKSLKMKSRVLERLLATTSVMSSFNEKTEWFLLKLTARKSEFVVKEYQ